MKKLFLTLILIMGISINSHAITGGAVSIEFISAEQTANPATVAGGATDAIVTYSNPASLGDIGEWNFTAGGHGLFFQIDQENAGVTTESDSEGVYVPSYAVSRSFMDGKFGFGIALVSPYGLKTSWSPTGPLRYIATNSVLKMFDLTPAISYRPNEKIAFGLGADYYNVTEAIIERKYSPDVINTVLGTPTAGSPDGNLLLDGDGSDWGYHAGILYDPSERHSFGMTYHSGVKMEIEGTLELTGFTGVGAVVMGGTSIKTKAVADFFFPQNILLGYAFKPNEKWRFEIDGHWFDWSSNKEFLARTPNVNATQAAVLRGPLPLEWKDVWSFAFGTTYMVNENWKLNGGIYHISAAVPDQTFQPSVPDSDRLGLSFGPSYKNGSFAADFAYSPIFYKDRNINNNIGTRVAGFASADPDGEYSGDIIHIIGLNLKYRYE